MKTKRELVHLLDLFYSVKEQSEEQEDSYTGMGAAFQIDVLEYALGMPDTRTEAFVASVAQDETPDTYAQDDLEDVLSSILNGSIERAYAGGR